MGKTAGLHGKLAPAGSLTFCRARFWWITLWAGVGLDLTWAQVEAIGRRHYRQDIGTLAVVARLDQPQSVSGPTTAPAAAVDRTSSERTPMTAWYSITPPPGRWPLAPDPSGAKQRAGRLSLAPPPTATTWRGAWGYPQRPQLWGPFWYNGTTLYVPVPQTVYALPDPNPTQSGGPPPAPPGHFFVCSGGRATGNPLPQHQGQDIELLGDRYSHAHQQPARLLAPLPVHHGPAGASALADPHPQPQPPERFSGGRRRGLFRRNDHSDESWLVPGGSAHGRLYPTPLEHPGGRGHAGGHQPPCGSRGIGWATPAPMPPEPFC